MPSRHIPFQMKLSVLLVIARLPLDFFQREVELNGKEKKCLYFKGIYLSKELRN